MPWPRPRSGRPSRAATKGSNRWCGRTVRKLNSLVQAYTVFIVGGGRRERWGETLACLSSLQQHWQWRERNIFHVHSCIAVVNNTLSAAGPLAVWKGGPSCSFFYYNLHKPLYSLCFAHANKQLWLPCYVYNKQPLALFQLALDSNAHAILGHIFLRKKVHVRVE